MTTERDAATAVRNCRTIRVLRAVLLSAVCWGSLAGCSDYPEVRDGESVELIAALRTACSSQRTDRLERCVQAIEERHAAGEMPDAEYEAFQAIIAEAQAGRWKEAEMETHRFQEAQVR